MINKLVLCWLFGGALNYPNYMFAPFQSILLLSWATDYQDIAS